jgi:hypothetical protein
MPFSCRERTTRTAKMPTISRAKRSAATAGWAVESWRYGVLIGKKSCGMLGHDSRLWHAQRAAYGACAQCLRPLCRACAVRTALVEKCLFLALLWLCRCALLRAPTGHDQTKGENVIREMSKQDRQGEPCLGITACLPR